MKTFDGMYSFFFFAAIMTDALTEVQSAMHNINEIESNSTDVQPPCIIDAPPYRFIGCSGKFSCPCTCPGLERKYNCSDGTPPDEFGACRVEFWLEPGQKACRIEWPRYPNGSCPEYLTCPNCRCYCPNCQPAIFNGPCPAGMRADQYHQCRRVLD